MVAYYSGYMVAWRKIKNTINSGDNYTLAISGGIDSMVLLDLFKRSSVSFTVVHFNHRIHSKSDDIADFVRSECAHLSYVQFDRDQSEPFKKNVECAARKWRYDILDSIASNMIVTGHHLNDQVENVLLRLMRGVPHTALAMKEVDGNRYKPFINVEKADLVKTAKVRNIKFMDDPTNTDITYDRNWVRHVLMPQMMERRNIMASIPTGISNTVLDE